MAQMKPPPLSVTRCLARLAVWLAFPCAILSAGAPGAAAPAPTPAARPAPAAPAAAPAAAAAASPGTVPAAPAIASWAKTDGGVEFTLADGGRATLLVRAPYSVRLTWTPPRPNKPEDWLIVPSANPDRAFTAGEAGGQVVVATSLLRFMTPRDRLALRAVTADGRPVADLPLADGLPLKIAYADTHATFYEDEHDYVWSYAPSGTRLELLRRYAEATGFPPMPPKWVMGIAHGGYAGEAQLPQIAAAWRQYRLPVDALWGDGGVFSDRTVNDFTTTWHTQTSKQLHDLHFVLGRWMMHSTRPGLTNWDELANHKWLATTPDGKYLLDGFWGTPVGGFCPDPFDPAAREAYKQEHARNQGLNAGFNFFKVDFRDIKYKEFFYPSHAVLVPKGFRPPFNDKGGTNPAWRLLLSRATFEATRDLNTYGQRGWVVTKYPVPGYQRYYCVWPDDHPGEFEDLHDSADIMLHYARWGVPWYCDDLGGFKTNRMPSKELFLRWFQYGVFTPWPTLFGKPRAGLRVPWEYDEETVRIFRKYDELRYRLIPYLYTYAHQAHTTGRPIVVPLDMAYPSDPKLRMADGGPSSANYLFGGELLVAPIVQPGAAAWDVYLPAGDDWIEYDTGKRHAGGTAARVDTPLDTYPLFVRAGAVIPMGPAGKQYVADGGLVDASITWDIYPKSPTAEAGAPATRTAATPAPPATAAPAAPAASSGFSLYEDDGLSGECDKGRFSLTPITVRSEAGGGVRTSVRIEQGATVGDFAGKPAARAYFFKINGQPAAPTRILVGGQPLPPAKSLAELESAAGPGGYFYEGASKIAWVKVQTPTRDPVSLAVDF